MDQRWKNFFEEEMKKNYMIELVTFIKERRKTVNVLPAPSQVFNAFTHCSWDTIKVVIVGQEPYPTAVDNHGLAFSSLSAQIPYALKNIFDEIYEDIFHGNTGGVKTFQTNNLTQWAEQGVLLLNSCLTLDEGHPGSHKGKGWELFIENTIKLLSDKHPFKLAFILMGKDAKAFKSSINTERHLVLETDHPAAARYNASSWFGCKVFSKANAFIIKEYSGQRGQIGWGTWVNKK